GGGFGGGGFPGGGGGIGGQFGQQQTLLPEGVDRVYAIEGDNSLLVFSTVDGFNLVKEIVKNLDIAPRQVQIKMEFVTAAVHDVDLFGINFSLIPSPSLQGAFSPASSTGAATSLTPSPPNTYLQFAYGNVAAQLYALLYKQRGKIVNAPLITTTNNTPAFIAFNSQIPFQTSNQTIIPNGGAVTTTTQNFQNILSTLQVQPRINGDDTVTLTLTPQISQPSGPATAGGPAPVSTQFLLATRTVRSGETMVVGGLVTKTDTFIESRIPILGDLPIIGQFFRSRNKDVNDSELLIFVTPTIIDENAQNTGITAEPQGAVGVNAAPGPQPNPGGQVTP
ncbi:MAG: type II and III secretion system protein, partial [Armatimonadetes bacterium]|nr:type II and III secretion system protein [Armatimonadota bacterium]